MICALLTGLVATSNAQSHTRDTVVYHYIYKDTVIHRKIYKHDTIHVRHYDFADTVKSEPASHLSTTGKRRRILLNPNNWGIGPSLGAYYSPINGFDVNIGFGIQYYILAVPSFRNPHLGHRRNRK